MASTVRLVDAAKSYGPTQALRGLDMTFEAGSIHALIGENGSGKSTTVGILAGTVTPDHGQIEVSGRTRKFHTPLHAVEAGISTVFQDLSLAPHLSVEDSITLGREQWRTGWRAESSARAAAALQRIDPTVDLRRRTGSLTLGQRQMVCIARAISSDAKLLVLDEPTAALTGPESQRLFALLRRLRDDGLAVMYISHRLPEVMELADTVTVLKDGTKVLGPEPMASMSQGQIVREMIGRELHVMFPSRQRMTPRLSPRIVGRGLHSADGTLRGADVEVMAGEVLGIAGLDGSGREALARLLGGVETPHAGVIETHSVGREAVTYTPGDRKRSAIVPAFNVRESITQGGLRRFTRLGLLRPQSEKKAAARLVAEFNVKCKSPEASILTLSGGNQQKVVMARAAARGSRALVAEEPTAGVDVGARAEIYRLLAQMADAGAAVVISSTDLPELAGLADRVLVMRRGVVATELSGDLLTEENLLSGQLSGSNEPSSST